MMYTMRSPMSVTSLLQIAIFELANLNTVVSSEEYPQCSITLDISQCTATHHHSNKSRIPPVDRCESDTICGHNFTISQFGRNVYGIQLVEDLLRKCCGSCTQTTRMDDVLEMSHLKEPFMEHVDFVFPVLGKADDTRLHGFYYIPLIETPQVYYITHGNRQILKDIVWSCLNLWPLLVVTALMVLISGFICWLMETWENREEFPRSFLIGWFEGVWWSFISMTTVGYGDKAPKSVAARIFSIIWIIIGIATFSLITASLTSVIVAINSSPPPTMEDSNVGVIQHHLYESLLVANQGGVVVDIHSPNISDGIHRMVDHLHDNKIDGFLVDRYALVLFYEFFDDHPVYGYDVSYIQNNGLLTDVTKTSTNYMFGILLKQRQHFHFLDEFVRSNRDVIDSCNRLFLSKQSRRVKLKLPSDPLFSTKRGMFWPTMYSLITMLVFIILMGVVYEVCRENKNLQMKKKEMANGNVKKMYPTNL